MQDPIQKKIFIVFIFVVCGFLLYWIAWFIIPTSSTPALSEVVSTSSSTNPLFQQNNISSLSSLLKDAPSPINLTKGLVNDMSQELISSMKLASSTKKEDLLSAIQKSGVSNISDATLQKYVSADKLGFVSTIPDSEIQTVPSSTQAQTLYKSEYGNAVSPFSSTSPVAINSVFTSFVQGGDSAGLDNLIQTYDNIYANLKKVRVPENDVLFHKENMKFFANLIVIFRGVREYQDDPLKAYLLGQQLSSVSDEWNNITTQFKAL